MDESKTENTEGNFELTRRDFLKISGVVTAGVIASNTVGASETKTKQSSITPRFEGKIVHSVCPYCAVGCGLKIYVKDNKVVHIEGDEENPINRGSLCSRKCCNTANI